MADRYDYDRNGSMTARNKDGAQPQLLKWDAANRLAQVTWASPAQSELYGYDENGRRIAKVAVDGNGLALFTFYPFAHYEQTGVNPEGVTKYYFFNGARIAQRRGAGAGSRLHFLSQDNLGSTIGTQEWGGVSYSASQGYYPFGAELRTRNALTTDYRFTGEEQDGTGLYYYGARFYDPQLGQFIAPDTLVPDTTYLMDYQRYAYARGSPLKFNDPSGRCPTPPTSMGAAICVALFIKPERVAAGPLLYIATVVTSATTVTQHNHAAMPGLAWIPTKLKLT